MQALDLIDQQATRSLKQQGWLPTKALQPVTRAFGPELPAENTPAAADMRTRWLARFGGGDLEAVDAL